MADEWTFKAAAPTGAATHPKTAKSAPPWAALLPLIQGQLAPDKPVGKVLDILSRPAQAAEAIYASPDSHKPDLKTAFHRFLHSSSPQEQETTFQQILTQVPALKRFEHNQTGLRKTLLDAGLHTAFDPTTFIGGSGALETAGRKLAPKVLPAVLKGAGRATETAVRAADRVGQGVNVREALDKAGEIAGGVYDSLGPHNRLGRKMVAQHGEAGRDLAQSVVMARNASKTQRASLQEALLGQFRDAIKGLSSSDEDAIYRALHTGTLAKLRPELQPAATRLATLTKTIAHLQGSKALQKKLAGEGFTLPEFAKPYDAPIPRRIQQIKQYRENYVPIAHDDKQTQFLDDALLQRQAKRRARYASQYDPNLQPRTGHADLLDPDLQREVFEGRLRGAAKSIAGRDTQTRLAKSLGTPARQLPKPVDEYINPEFVPSNAKHPVLRAAGAVLRPAVDLPKQALFALPFRHMLNISTLAGLHDPGALAEALPTFAKMYGKKGFKPAAERSALLKDAEHGGVISPGQGDRAHGFLQHPSLKAKEGPVVGAGLGNLYGASSNALWGWDDAVKAATYRRAIRRGRSPEEASRETLNALIDYGNTSDLTKGAAYVAPFATYRSKLPGAIARATLKHPERPLTVNRAAPALAGGEQPSSYTDETSKEQVARGYTPLSDIYEGVDNPWAFARTTLSWPAQLAATASGMHSNPKDGGYQNYFLYGYPRDKKGHTQSLTAGEAAKYAINQMPYLQNVLQAEGAGVFPDRGALRTTVEGQTGVRLTYPKKKKAPAATTAAPAARTTSTTNAWNW